MPTDTLIIERPTPPKNDKHTRAVNRILYHLKLFDREIHQRNDDDIAQNIYMKWWRCRGRQKINISHFTFFFGGWHRDVDNRPATVLSRVYFCSFLNCSWRYFSLYKKSSQPHPSPPPFFSSFRLKALVYFGKSLSVRPCSLNKLDVHWNL